MKPAYNFAEIEEGRRLHYVCDGPEDAPFVLFDSGAFGIFTDGWWVKEELKFDFRVCLFDRASMGGSDPAPSGQRMTPQFHVEDMRRLIKYLGVEKQVTLVGHSMSGLRLHSFANQYRDELNGLVFVDAVSPRMFKDMTGRLSFEPFGWLLSAGALGAQFGLAGPLSQFTPKFFKLEGDLRQHKVWSYGAASHHAASRDEVQGVEYEADYLHGDDYQNLPTAIFASTYINGMKEEDAEIAKQNTGYGWYGHFPKDDHVSILIEDKAALIAKKVREINSL